MRKDAWHGFHGLINKLIFRANATQVVEANSFCSLRMYVKRAAVPPPSECPTTYIESHEHQSIKHLRRHM
jgi:hypothetical protein